MEPRTTEDRFTETMEILHSCCPVIAVTMGAMVLSLACQVAGKGDWGNFITQWCQPG
jgi:hypothetical protein